MKQLIKENRYFFIPYAVFLLISVFLLLYFPKAQLHIIFNKANSPFFDSFFKYATYMGDGYMLAALFVVLIFIKYRYAFAFLLANFIIALIVNFLKRTIFLYLNRPSKYFELYETYKLHLVEGIKLHVQQSFPSGHTATAFTLFLMLAFLIKNNGLKFCCFLIALLVAYSRVYISQHFFIDIVGGSILGVALTTLIFIWFETFNKSWLNNALFKRKAVAKANN